LGRVRSIQQQRETSLALRVMAALVVWLAALGHLTGLAHFALISHHVCAEHGELTHAEEGDHAHARGASPEAPSPAFAPSTEDEHEHCSVLARRDERATLTRSVAAVAAPGAAEPSPPPSSEALPRPGAELFRLAPKTSPPV
jgi:hypothetical protein